MSPNFLECKIKSSGLILSFIWAYRQGTGRGDKMGEFGASESYKMGVDPLYL